ncbi:MAG: hypothetical protein ABSA01_15755 [Anaerolineales bacterium]|jgi:hypothetical protein
MASYQAINPRELASYADQHIGDNVKVKVTIFNIVDDQDLQGVIYGRYDAVCIATSVPFSRIYKGDVINVYGTVSCCDYPQVVAASPEIAMRSGLWIL